MNSEPAPRAHGAPGPVSRGAIGAELHHHPLVRADGIGVGGDFREARVAHEIEIAALVARQREIEGLAGGRDELHQRQIRAAAQRLEIRDFE